MTSSMLIAIEHNALFLRFLIIFYISVIYVNCLLFNVLLIYLFVLELHLKGRVIAYSKVIKGHHLPWG